MSDTSKKQKRRKNNRSKNMHTQLPDYQLIESDEELVQFYQAHQDVSWLAFDTEFVGEKRYFTALCLIQIASEKGIFLIDPFRAKDLSPFLQLMQDPRITKITHAGDNDYRLLYQQYGILPANVFDTQVAAGFVGYNYPTSFGKLVEGELGIALKKGFAVTDWEARPLKPKQLKYAIDDVLYLERLWQKLLSKLEKLGRRGWAEEEFRQFEAESAYYRGPHSEAVNSKLMQALRRKDRVFLLRLLEWRRQLAEKRNHSKDMVLASKYLSHIVRGISSGSEALRQNRRIPDKVAKKYGQVFEEMYQTPVTEEENQVLDTIPSDIYEDPKEAIVLEMLYLVIKYKCMEEDMAINMALPRHVIKKIRAKDNEVQELLQNSWRKEWLGDYFVDWLATAQSLDLELLKEQIVLRPK